MLHKNVGLPYATDKVPCGCPCDKSTCTLASGHWWTREEVAQLLRIEPRTLADLIRNNTRCPLHGVGHGRGSRGPRYSWGEVQALKAWLEGGRC